MKKYLILSVLAAVFLLVSCNNVNTIRFLKSTASSEEKKAALEEIEKIYLEAKGDKQTIIDIAFIASGTDNNLFVIMSMARMAAAMPEQAGDFKEIAKQAAKTKENAEGFLILGGMVAEQVGSGAIKKLSELGSRLSSEEFSQRLSEDLRNLDDKFENIVDKLEDVFKKLGDKFEGMDEKFEDAFKEFGDNFGDTFGEGLEELGDNLGDTFDELGDKMGDAFDDFGDKMDDFFE